MLTAFEYMHAFGLETVLAHMPGTQRPLEGRHKAYALVELSSPDPDADLGARLETVLAQAFEDDLVQDAVLGSSEAQNDALWYLREAMSEAQKFEGGSIKHDVSVPTSRVAAFIEDATAACEAEMEGLRVCPFGHFGDGNIHFNISQPVGMEKADFLARWDHFNGIVHDIVRRYGGTISAEHGIGLVKMNELPRYKDPVALDLMRAIKRAVDPDNIMNPGKIFRL
jgi:FAD/FMN-containing dehydrogenase